MKNIYFTHLGQYKILQTNLLLFLILILFTSNTINAQDGGQTPVAINQYSVIKRVTYAIPSNSSISEISDFDIASIRPYKENSNIKVSLMSDGSLKTETIYPEGVGGLDPWISKHYKSVFTKNSMIYYDENNNILFQNNVNFNELLPTSTEFINQFGYYPTITAPSNSEMNSILQSGMTIQLNQDGSYSINSGDYKIILNPLNNTKETIYFKNGVIDFSELERYHTLSNNKSILISKITKSYFQNARRTVNIEKRVEELYYNHILNGNNVANASSKTNFLGNESFAEKSIEHYDPNVNQTLSFLVSPNPSSGEINVQFPSSEKFELQVLNFDGKLIKTLTGEGNIKKLDLSTLEKGVYILKMQLNSTIQYQKIVLQ